MTDQQAAGSGRRFLVVVRAGDSSLHSTWTSGERAFDLAVDYYGDTPGRWAGTADFHLESKGSKWAGLHRFISENRELVERYDAVWFPDDDLATDAATINALFELHTSMGLGLSQPSLTADSYYTHLITLAHPGLSVRITSFVEVMAPLFSRDALRACAPTFGESNSGYGLDLAWQSMLPGLGLKSAIFDCLQVRHTRPLGSGTLYAGMTESPVQEGARVARAHGMPSTTPAITVEALDDALHVVSETEVAQRILAAPPQPTVQEVPAWDLYLGELRARVSALPADSLAPVAALPAAALTRTVAASGRGEDAADLSHLDPDLPVALVVADDGLDRVLAWRAAGWQTVMVPTGDDALLADHLALAEVHPARVLDVEAPSAAALEVAVRLGERAGAAVIGRAPSVALRCTHAMPEAVRTALGRCEACRTQWAAVAERAGALGVPDTASVERLVELGVDRALVETQVTVPPAPPAPTAVTGTAVVLFAHAQAGFTAAALDALSRQRGLAAPLEVVVVPAARAAVHAPRPAMASGGLRVTTAPAAGPAGFAAAVRAVRAPRVLVLDATDVPGPWCVHDHAGAASDVAVSRGRTSFVLADDPWTDAAHAPGATPSAAQRVSVPVEVATSVSALHAIASAATATSVLTAGRPVAHLLVPTHSAIAFDDLDAHLRSATLAALAGAVAVPTSGPVPAALTAELTHWSHVRERMLDLLRQVSDAPADRLRGLVANWVTGERGTDVVARVLAEATTAHWAAAMGAASAARAAGSRGEPLVVSLAARDARLLDLLRPLASGGVSAKAFQVLLVLDPREGDERTYAQRFAAQVTGAGIRLEDLPDVRVVTSDEPATARLDAHVTLPVDGAAWYPGLPVPLMGLPLGVWLSYLDVAHLLERPTRDLTTADSRQGASC